jgi:hypothetical protein
MATGRNGSPQAGLLFNRILEKVETRVRWDEIGIWRAMWPRNFWVH